MKQVLNKLCRNIFGKYITKQYVEQALLQLQQLQKQVKYEPNSSLNNKALK